MGLVRDQPGGANRYLSGLATGLAGRGHDVRLLLPRVSAALPEREHWEGTRVIRFGAPHHVPGLRVLASARAARRAAFEEAVDIVDSHLALYGVGPFLALPHVAHVSTFHGPWSAEGRALGESITGARLKLVLERAAYRRSARLITLSHAFAAILQRDYRVPQTRIDLVPPGVRLDHFTPDGREAARNRLGIPDGQFAVLAVRRLIPRVGLELLIGAAGGLVPGSRRTTLLIAGEGPSRADLERRAARVGAATVRFLGRVPDEDLPDLYRAADLSVVPSVTLEGFGMVVPESLACGTPVLATTVGGLPEALDGLGAGWVVPPVEEALRQALLRAREGELPSRAHCRAMAERRFGFDAWIDRAEKAYTAAVRERAA
jgi:glycosyltransferase involved in cell wall biosynthesis